MSARKDLTRWNRAGLSRFRYIDGNAIEYLEALRLQLHEKFGDSETGPCAWLNPAEKTPANEKAAESENLTERQERLSRRQERIVDFYHQDRRDWAWEISRTFARACHVLTEHTNAYANEAYLGTATQWDHIRRLVEMLDYHPAPPASATTLLAFIAKDNGTDGENQTAVVPKGFQVKHSPENGGAKIIFETLQDLNIDPALNGLRPKGWNQSDEPAASPDTGSTPPTTDERQFSVVAGGPVINIEGVGPGYALELDGHSLADSNGFTIRNFVGLNPDNSDLDIATNLLWEWKAKADVLIDFALDANWSAVEEWLLPDIASASAELLAEQSGNSVEQAEALKLQVEIVAICLDQPIVEQTALKDLIAPLAPVTATVETTWYAERKPEVLADEVAMVMDREDNLAEAVTIDSLEHISAEVDLLDIQLLPSPAQLGWKTWSRARRRCTIRRAGRENAG